MKNLEIEERKHLFIQLDNEFYIEGFVYNEFWIDWYICNNRYGVKQLIFGVDKDFDIKNYIKNNYHDILGLYVPYMDVEDMEALENDR